MTLSKIHFIILLLLIFPYTIDAQEINWRDFKINLNRITEVQDSFVIKKDGEKIGSWQWDVNVNEQSIIFKDRSVLFGKVWEDAIFEVDKKTLEEYRIDSKTIFGENSVQNNSTIKNQQLIGLFTRTVNKHTTFFNLDSNYTNLHMIPRAIFLGLLPGIFNKVGFSASINFYIESTHSIGQVNFKIKPKQIVSIEAGTFDTIPIEILSVGNKGVSNIFYLNTQYPYSPVKVDVIEQNMVIELTKK